MDTFTARGEICGSFNRLRLAGLYQQASTSLAVPSILPCIERGETLLRIFLLIIASVGLMAHSAGIARADLVIKKTASGQLSKRLSTLEKPLGGSLQLQSINVKQKTIEVRFGVASESPTLFHVSLVHPTEASAEATCRDLK